MTRPLRVLFVEDSPDDAELLAGRLRHAGYDLTSERVQTESTLRAALVARVWDIVLSDYSMPQFDAKAAIAVVCELRPALPIIVISGTVGEDIAVETLKLGADDYLLKDHLVRFVPAVERALRGAEEHRERLQAQEQLRESEAMMSAAQRIASFGSWVVRFGEDPAAPAILWSDECYRVFGFEPRAVEVTPELWMDRVHPADRTSVREAARRALETHAAVSVVHRVILPGGEERHVQQQARPFVCEATGRLVKMVGTAHDITESVLARTRLEQALEREKELARQAQAGERAKTEFLAVMSHEIRTPMNAMLGFAELLGATNGLPPQCHDYVRTINASGNALLRILDDILEFSRLEAGRLPIERGDFSPRALLVEVHGLMRPLAEDKGLALEFEIDPAVPQTLISDAGRLHQVLVNLAGNAIKFTTRGRVVLGLRLLAGQRARRIIEFFVRDTGPGIPEDKLAVIFGAFIQADSSLRRRYGGTGLGLAISRRLVELMDGELLVRSEEGEGAEFLVRIPMDLGTDLPVIHRMPRDEWELADASFAARYPHQILVVDDDAVNLRLLVDILHRLGYQLQSATDGVEALAKCEQHEFDLIFMDIHLPGIDGLEATEKLRAIERQAGDGRRATIIAVTANVYTRERCLAAGVDAFLTKPLRISALTRVLAQEFA